MYCTVVIVGAGAGEGVLYAWGFGAPTAAADRVFAWLGAPSVN